MPTFAVTRRTPNPLVLGALAAAPILLAHAPSFFHRLLDGDEAIYGSIAALMNGGAPLYAEGGVDNKPPGILWVYAATFRVQRCASIHQCRDRSVDSLVPIEEPVEERGRMRKENWRRGQRSQHQRIWSAAGHRERRHGVHLYCCTVGR